MGTQKGKLMAASCFVFWGWVFFGFVLKFSFIAEV